MMTVAELQNLILRTLAQRPANALELADVLEVWAPDMRDQLRAMRRLGLVAELPTRDAILWRLTDKGWHTALPILHPQLRLVSAGEVFNAE